MRHKEICQNGEGKNAKNWTLEYVSPIVNPEKQTTQEVTFSTIPRYIDQCSSKEDIIELVMNTEKKKYILNSL